MKYQIKALIIQDLNAHFRNVLVSEKSMQANTAVGSC